MTRFFFLLLAGTATLIAATAAEARDGCGQGWFHNGVACARQEGPSYGRRYGGYDGGYYGGGYQRPRPEGSWRAPNFGGNVVRPTRGNNGAMSCSNAGYTWQNGACRPYRGG